MRQRVNFFEKGQDAIRAMYGLGAYMKKSSIEISLQYLIAFRVSQINGCAYCLDMHAKDLRELGESEQRLYLLNAWRESPVYSDRECAALAYAEAVTKLHNGQVPDAIFDGLQEHFSDEEIIALTISIIGINSWNRINIALGNDQVGNYQPGQFAAH